MSPRAFLVVLAMFAWSTIGWGQAATAQSSEEAGPLPSEEVEDLLQEIIQLTEEALAASRSAEEAESVEEIKAGAEAVFEAVWGLPSGRSVDQVRGASEQHGWQIRWQTSPGEYDEAFAERLGSSPPAIEDPRQLGIVGRGRYLRAQFAVVPEGPTEPGFHYTHDNIIAPLNNVIGWMRMGDGITKGEHQPRVDLTYMWDAPTDFWKSTADTGWIHEAFSQALNILKVDYQGDLEMARDHAAAMTELIEKSLHGIDADGNGRVEPIAMEGGLHLALEEARAADVAAR